MYQENTELEGLFHGVMGEFNMAGKHFFESEEAFEERAKKEFLEVIMQCQHEIRYSGDGNRL